RGRRIPFVGVVAQSRCTAKESVDSRGRGRGVGSVVGMTGRRLTGHPIADMPTPVPPVPALPGGGRGRTPSGVVEPPAVRRSRFPCPIYDATDTSTRNIANPISYRIAELRV